jgi:hypothetical protein
MEKSTLLQLRSTCRQSCTGMKQTGVNVEPHIPYISNAAPHGDARGKYGRDLIENSRVANVRSRVIISSLARNHPCSQVSLYHGTSARRSRSPGGGNGGFLRFSLLDCLIPPQSGASTNFTHIKVFTYCAWSSAADPFNSSG